jgi:hypothetical protein
MEDGNRNFQLPFGKKIQPMFKSSLLSHKISGTMVEKVVDNAGAEEDTVLVQAFSDVVPRRQHVFREQTLGAAIEAFEEIASDLFSLQVFKAAKEDEEDKGMAKFSVAGKLLRLPMMIELGITAAIDQNKSTHQSIGTAVSGESALVEGNIVALYNIGCGSFVRMKGNSVDCKGGPKVIDQLPFEWDSERFLVVNAGKGRIALYSPSHRRFLASHKGCVEASVYPIGKLEDCPRCNESFRVHVNIGGKNTIGPHRIQLYCDMDEESQVSSILQVVQIHGFKPAK